MAVWLRHKAPEVLKDPPSTTGIGNPLHYTFYDNYFMILFIIDKPDQPGLFV